jgi:carbamoyl-phosphate synthase small subunit
MEVSEGKIDSADLVREAKERPALSEFDFVHLVSTKKPLFYRSDDNVQVPDLKDLKGKRRCVIIDCGLKRSIARNLGSRGFDVVILPYNATADQVASLEPDFMLISNGPGDPVRLTEPQEVVRRLAPEIPMMNICMGHLTTALALGAKTFKLKFGHRGGNHPVKDLERNNVYITTQNHGFAVDPDTLPGTGLRMTMKNLNDGSIEGLDHEEYGIMTTQFHPEATPGPLDATFMFDEFIGSLG